MRFGTVRRMFRDRCRPRGVPTVLHGQQLRPIVRRKDFQNVTDSEGNRRGLGGRPSWLPSDYILKVVDGVIPHRRLPLERMASCAAAGAVPAVPHTPSSRRCSARSAASAAALPENASSPLTSMAARSQVSST